MDKQEDFTVVLLRPDYVCDTLGENYGDSVYVAFVQAKDCKTALAKAAKQAFDRDTADELEPEQPEDYALCVMFPGHITPCLFGWQV